MSALPSLTICIPTFNRAGHIQKLATHLLANIADNPAYSLEIIIADNASNDGTSDVLRKFSHPRLRVVRHAQHYPTAEENVMRSTQLCKGEFIWFLGDDDITVIDGFEQNYNLLSKRDADYFLFNPAITNHRGNLEILQNIRINRPEIRTSIHGLIALVGLQFTLAGLSNQIIRRRMLDVDRGLFYLRKSPIYSHVAWIVDALGGKRSEERCVLVNRPLVYYRENDYSDGHWRRRAAREKIGDHYCWCGGLVKLLSALIEEKQLTPAEVGGIFEVDRNGGRYRLIDDVLFKYFNQLQTARAYPSEPRQRITDEEFATAEMFFYSVDPTTYDLVKLLGELRALVGKRREFDRSAARFEKVFRERQSAGQFAPFVSQVAYGYEIIKTPLQYVAIRQGVGREAVMQTIDPLSRGDEVLVAENLDGLLAQAASRAARAKSRRVSLGGSYPAGAVSAEAARSAALERLIAVYTSDIWQATYPYRVVKELLSAMWQILTAPIRLATEGGLVRLRRREKKAP